MKKYGVRLWGGSNSFIAYVEATSYVIDDRGYVHFYAGDEETSVVAPGWINITLIEGQS